MQRYALFSINNKNDIYAELAKELLNRGYGILATEGTRAFLEGKGVKVVPLQAITGFAEFLGGKVKTLNQILHSMILCDRNLKDEIDQIKNYGLIDFVIVNLYSANFNDLNSFLKSIDIGGRSLINSAIKNFEHVTIVVDEEDCKIVMKELKEKGYVDLEIKKHLALKAFEYLIDYEAKLFTYFYENVENKLALFIALKGGKKIKYGENPHQKAYIFENETDSSLRIELIKGELSYNNYLDMSRAISLLAELGYNACTIIKHTNPSSAAISSDPKTAFLKAYRADPVSAYGGVLAISAVIDKELAEEISQYFFDVIVARDFEEEAIEILSKRKKTRIVKCPGLGTELKQAFSMRDVINGILIQERDLSKIDVSNLKVVSKRIPNEDEMKDLIFAWKVVKHVFSNAIVVAKGGVTLGICGGQTSRVFSTEIALKRAGDKAKGALLASDGFFPFRDSIDLAAKYGIVGIIEPGGSIRDEEVIKAADEHNISLVFTSLRCFRH